MRCVPLLVLLFASWTVSPGEAQRPASIEGDWDWSDGTRIAIRADGTFLTPNDGGGSWRIRGRDRFIVRWGDGPVDEVRLSSDRSMLEGVRSHGRGRARIWARRFVVPVVVPVQTPEPRVVTVQPAAPRDCGTGADPGCQESRDGIFALDGVAFEGLLATLASTSSEISKRNMIISATRSSGLTAAQLIRLLGLFRSEVTKLQVVRGVVARVIDPQRALGYGAQMRSNINRERLVRLLSEQPASSPASVTPAPAPPPRPAPPSRPARVCPPMPACGIGCPYGMARDENGCALCACNPHPLGTVVPSTR